MSIHDVMPHTLDEVGELLELCHTHAVRQVALLVVPGLPWPENDVQQLLAWQKQGCELAAHGWKHHCDRISSWYHRWHSCLLSRRVAEHLSLSSDETSDLMRRSSEWFAERGLPLPDLYVPPAWALGKLNPLALRSLPFRMVETLAGVTLLEECRNLRLPLVGFEADTWLRQVALGAFNCTMRNLARWHVAGAGGCGICPLRIAIHPFDHRLRMQDDLRQILAQDFECLSYGQLLPPMAGLHKKNASAVPSRNGVKKWESTPQNKPE